MLSISRLGAQEIESLKSLYSVFVDVLEMDEKSLPDDSYLYNQLSNNSIYIIVAKVDSNIVGGLTSYRLPMIYRTGEQLYIEDLGIAEKFQRQGIGTQLMNFAFELANEEGITEIYVEAEADDPEAQSFYTSLKPIETIPAIHFVYGTAN